MNEFLTQLQHVDPVINMAMAYIVYRGVQELGALNKKIAVIIARVDGHESELTKHDDRITFLERKT